MVNEKTNPNERSLVQSPVASSPRDQAGIRHLKNKSYRYETHMIQNHKKT